MASRESQAACNISSLHRPSAPAAPRMQKQCTVGDRLRSLPSDPRPHPSGDAKRAVESRYMKSVLSESTTRQRPNETRMQKQWVTACAINLLTRGPAHAETESGPSSRCTEK